MNAVLPQIGLVFAANDCSKAATETRLRTLVILGGALIALAAVLAGGSYALLKPEAIAANLVHAIKDQSGYTLNIGGAPEFLLWPTPAVTLKNVSLEGGKSDAGSATLSAEKLVIVTDFGALFSGAFRPTSLEASGVKVNLLIDGKGKASWPAKSPHLPVPLKIINGSVAFLDERSGSSFRASGLEGVVSSGSSDEDLHSYGQFVWRKQPVRYTLQLKSLARLMEDGSPVSATANGPLVDFYFDGRAGFSKSLALAGQASINSDDFRGLSRWLGFGLGPGNGLSSFMMSGAIDSRGAKAVLTHSTISLDETTAKGSLSLDLTGRIPMISGSLNADQIDLSTYIGEADKPITQWSIKPLSFATLGSFNTALDVHADVATYGDLEFRNITSRVTQLDGNFEASIPQMTIGGNKASARVSLSDAAKLPVISVNFTGEKIDAQAFFESLLGFSAIKGRATVSAVLSGSGKSQAEIISTLKGTASITMADGSFEQVDPGALLKQVSTRIVEGWHGESSARFTDLGASFAVQDGIATISAMSYSEGPLSMTIKGEADVLRRAVNLRVEPRYTETGGKTAAWPVQVAITGPWEKPKLFPDIAGLAANPAEGFQKLKTMAFPVLPNLTKN